MNDLYIKIGREYAEYIKPRKSKNIPVLFWNQFLNLYCSEYNIDKDELYK